MFGRERDKRSTNARLRQRLFDFLGNKCVRCGFDDIRALQVDHVHGQAKKGSLHDNSGSTLYLLILNRKVPKEDFQTLCANCNCIKRVENGESRGYHRPLELNHRWPKRNLWPSGDSLLTEEKRWHKESLWPE